MGPRHRLLARELASPCPSTRAGRKIDLYEACAVDGRSARTGASGLYDLAEAVASGPQATEQSLEGNGRARVNLTTGGGRVPLTQFVDRKPMFIFYLLYKQLPQNLR